MKSKKVGIIGCGKIFPRHLEAIQGNPDYELVGVCDVDKELVEKRHIETGAKAFVDYRQMIDSGEVNFVVVATPNSQHFEQAKYALMNRCDALIEKPATIDPMQIEMLKKIADECHQRVYAVLQVRLNSCIQSLKHLVDNKIIGEIRGVGLIQRWQRPLEYFSDWRGSPLVGGGTLHECGIHYLDILCYILGKPEVVASKKYNTKHKGTSIEDTVYATLDYGSFGGNVEISISAEPSNIECSLTILTDIGYIRLGGRAMNVVEKVDFLSEDKTRQVKKILEKNNSIGTPNSYGSYAGSCPNHPNLYKNIHNFDLLNTSDVLNLIDEIYANCGIKYY
jgi:UDP-N-acetyl-2-amino-2-deoxyglucuronate dehydrogenase